MKKEIQFKTTPVRGDFKKGEASCRGTVIHSKTLDIDGIAEDFARFAKLDIHDARYYASYFVDYMVHALGSGSRLNLGAFSLYLAMTGTFEGANGAFDARKNRLEVKIAAQKPMKDALSSLEPVNVTMDGETMRITSIIDDADGREGVITPGAMVYAAGCTFLVDATRDDEGIWLENDAGEIIMRGTVVASTATTLDCIFEGDAPPGDCRFVVCTRMGERTRAAPAICRRRVRLKR